MPEQWVEFDVCRQAGMLYDRIVEAVEGSESPIAKWVDHEAGAVISGRFPPEMVVTDDEWLTRMRILAALVGGGR